MDNHLKCPNVLEILFLLNDLLNEVNKDSVRFMMLNRGNDVELDFDFNKVLKKIKIIPFFMFNIVMQE